MILEQLYIKTQFTLMEFITRNQHLIMTWYNKQIQKENMLDEIPDVTGSEDFMKSYVPRIFRVMLQKHNFENIIKSILTLCW